MQLKSISKNTIPFMKSNIICISWGIWLRWFCFSVFIILCHGMLDFSIVYGDVPTLQLRRNQQKYKLGPYIEILEDKKRVWQIQDVTNYPLATKFKPTKSNSINFGITSSALWIRFTVSKANKLFNSDNQEMEWILDLGRIKMLKSCTLYIPKNNEDNEWSVFHRTLQKTVETKSSHLRQLTFKLPDNMEIPTTFYLRVEHHSALFLVLKIYSSEAYFKDSKKHLIWLGVYFGVIAAMLLFNLFVYISLREKLYIYYILYVFSVLFYFLFLNGLMFEYIVPGPMKLHHTLQMVSLGFTAFWGTYFVKKYLVTEQYSKPLDKSLIIIMALAIFQICMSPFVHIKYLNNYSSLLGMLSSATILLAAIICWRRGFQPVGFFITAWSILCVGAFTYAMTYRGILPYTKPTFFSFQIGSGIEVIVLSFALADRLKILRRELRKSEKRYSNILYSIEEGYYEVDLAGNLTFFNEAWSNILGYSKNELVNMNYLSYMSKQTAQEVYQTFNKVYQTGKPTKAFDWETIRKDGTKRILEMSISIIRDSKLRPIGYRGIARDITERRIAEEKADFQQQQLMQASKMAAIGTLVSGMAHEISNPNNLIMTNTSILSDAWKNILPILEEYYAENGEFIIGGMPYTKMRDKLPGLLSGVSGGSKRINTIIDDLKHFVRKEAPEHNETVFINDVIKSAVSLLSSMIKKSTYKFTTAYGSNLPTFKGNSQRLEQVIINIIQNACQSLENKQKGIFVSTMYDKNMEQIVINIKDEGGGITKDNIKKINASFYTTKRDSGGIGLGLSISENIIKEHNGNITFKSEVGIGTDVLIKLPVSNNKLL